MALTFAEKHDAWQGRGKSWLTKPNKPLTAGSYKALPPPPIVTPASIAASRAERVRHLAKLAKRAKRRY
jgi:hypothetical protein